MNETGPYLVKIGDLSIVVLVLNFFLQAAVITLYIIELQEVNWTKRAN